MLGWPRSIRVFCENIQEYSSGILRTMLFPTILGGPGTGGSCRYCSLLPATAEGVTAKSKKRFPPKNSRHIAVCPTIKLRPYCNTVKRLLPTILPLSRRSITAVGKTRHAAVECLVLPVFDTRWNRRESCRRTASSPCGMASLVGVCGKCERYGRTRMVVFVSQLRERKNELRFDHFSPTRADGELRTLPVATSCADRECSRGVWMINLESHGPRGPAVKNHAH